MHALYLHKLQITDDEYLTAVRSCIAGKLRHCLSICHQIPPCSSWYTKNTTSMNKQQLFLPVVTHKVKDRMPQPHDAAASAHCHGGTRMSATRKNQPRSKPQLWLLRAASRLRKRHCVVVKNQSLTPSLHQEPSGPSLPHDIRLPFCNFLPWASSARLPNDSADFHRHAQLGPSRGRFLY